jgi:hypothetical protein
MVVVVDFVLAGVVRGNHLLHTLVNLRSYRQTAAKIPGTSPLSGSFGLLVVLDIEKICCCAVRSVFYTELGWTPLKTQGNVVPTFIFTQTTTVLP